MPPTEVWQLVTDVLPQDNQFLQSFTTQACPQPPVPLPVSNALEQEAEHVINEIRTQVQQVQDGVQYLSEVMRQSRSLSSTQKQLKETRLLPPLRLPMPDIEEISARSSAHNSDASLFGASFD